MNTTTPDERSEKDGLAREPRELSSEELESIIGGVGIEIGSDRVRLTSPSFSSLPYSLERRILGSEVGILEIE